MAHILTIQGAVDVDRMGVALLHEHVLIQFDDSRRKASVDFALKMLKDASDAGIQTLVDLWPQRRIDWYIEIAQQVAINIVPCTGFYREQVIPSPMRTLTESQMLARMVRELTEGIDNTPVRAGIIKVAADSSQLTPWEVSAFRAAAKAQVKTGACIATHACTGARAQADVLLRAGADLSRVFFSHIETESTWEGRTVKETARYLKDIAREGGALLFNNFGCEFYTKWTDMIYLLDSLCDAGYQEKILISIDANWSWNQNGKIEFEAEDKDPEAARRTYAYMMTDTVPDLLKSGFTDQDIQTFLVDNPRLFFSRSTLV